MTHFVLLTNTVKTQAEARESPLIVLLMHVSSMTGPRRHKDKGAYVG